MYLFFDKTLHVTDIPLRNTSLYICNIPPGYGLFSLQQLIEKYLDDPDGIRSIEFIKQGDTGDCTVAEIHFRLPQRKLFFH